MAANDDAPASFARRWSWLLLVVLAVILGRMSGSALNRSPAPLAGAHGGGAMGWVAIAGAERQSSATGRPILYEFNAAWCGPCLMLNHEVFSDAGHARAIVASVVPVSVVDRYREDGHNPPEVDALQQRFQVQAFPTLVVLSPATGRFEKSEGYMGPDATVEWIAKSAASLR